MVVSTEVPTATTAQPQLSFVGPTVSHLCSLLPRPLILTGIFREILVRHFSSPEFIETPELAHLVWKAGEQTGILVESIHRWRPELTEHRPAIIIKRNAYANRRLGIGDKLNGSPTRSGNAHYSTLWIGSHTLFCIGGSGAQAELLATEVQREVHHFGPVIARTALLQRLQVLEVGAVAELEESSENFVVPISVGYGFMEQWVIRQEAPTLRRISLSYVLDG